MRFHNPEENIEVGYQEGGCILSFDCEVCSLGCVIQCSGSHVPKFAIKGRVEQPRMLGTEGSIRVACFVEGVTIRAGIFGGCETE